MPTKAELYAQMADKVATQLTGSWQEWLYKYPFQEQLMIYAQRPDATACPEYDLWNEKMGRYVRRGSKGIALVDDSGDRPRLRYVFDIFALVPVSKKSASVYKSVVILYKSIFRAAMESRIIDHNPTIYLTTKGGGVPQEDRQALTDEQAFAQRWKAGLLTITQRFI